MDSGKGGYRILVVDDYPDTVEVICTMLELLGHVPLGVSSGVEALEELPRFAPEIVLLDISLPVMDGFEIARRLCERAHGRAPYMVALTGWGLEADRRRILDAGFSDYFLKPADSHTLRRLIAGYHARTRPPSRSGFHAARVCVAS